MYFTAEYRRKVDETLQQMDPKLYDLLQDVYEKMLDMKLDLIELCNTPIEKLLVVPLSDIVEELPQGTENIIAANCLPQHQIVINKKKYIVDFLVQVLMSNDYTIQFVIECDGHDFHEKSKEQVRADKKRERDLLSDGFHVIRFSGSEIYDDPYECCEDIGRIIKSRIRELFLTGNSLDK